MNGEMIKNISRWFECMKWSFDIQNWFVSSHKPQIWSIRSYFFIAEWTNLLLKTDLFGTMRNPIDFVCLSIFIAGWANKVLFENIFIRGSFKETAKRKSIGDGSFQIVYLGIWIFYLNFSRKKWHGFLLSQSANLFSMPTPFFHSFELFPDLQNSLSFTIQS